MSGGADGIDTAGHRAALLEGGTVFVPPVGLAQFRWRGGRGMRLAGRTAGWCMVGQFPLGSGWRTPQALMRNRTIVALSEAVVAFEPRDGGGTWHSSINALRMGRPLFVVCASTSGPKARGQRKLVRMGAAALDPVRMPDAAAFRQMVADYRVPPAPAQAPLFGRRRGVRRGGEIRRRPSARLSVRWNWACLRAARLGCRTRRAAARW